MKKYIGTKQVEAESMTKYRPFKNAEECLEEI